MSAAIKSPALVPQLTRSAGNILVTTQFVSPEDQIPTGLKDSLYDVLFCSVSDVLQPPQGILGGSNHQGLLLTDILHAASHLTGLLRHIP